MAKRITEMVGGESHEYVPMGKYVVRAPEVCGGRPTFKYTRIEIAGTLERLDAGENMEEIVAGYGGRVSQQAIMEALQLATSISRKQHIRLIQK